MADCNHCDFRYLALYPNDIIRQGKRGQMMCAKRHKVINKIMLKDTFQCQYFAPVKTRMCINCAHLQKTADHNVDIGGLGKRNLNYVCGVTKDRQSLNDVQVRHDCIGYVRK